MTDALQVVPNDETVLGPAAVPAPSVFSVHSRALALAVGRARGRLAQATHAATDAKETLQQIRQAIDPREVAGGYAGLTAGEAVGGVIGGVAGAAVAGPAGAVVGAEVGAFTMGMLGLKLGMDAVGGYLKPKDAVRASTPDAELAPGRKGFVFLLRDKAGERRIGEVVGLTSGATVGLVVAGPAGGLLGAVVGEHLGGRVGANAARLPAEDGASSLPKPGERASQWLERFGKKTAGEATTVLVAGSVGSLFGPSGIKVGQRVGRVVGQRVEWHNLGRPAGHEDHV